MDEGLTTKELAEIYNRTKGLTGDRWELGITGMSVQKEDSTDDIIIVVNDRVGGRNDADFIVHARKDIPKLLAEIDRLNNILYNMYSKSIT